MKIAPQFLVSQQSYTNLEIFGKKLGGYSTAFQLGICVVGTLFFHVLSGICLEHIYQLPSFHYGIFLTFVQFLIYTTLAKIGLQIRGEKKDRPQYGREAYQWYFIIALFMITSMALTNHAMHFVPYTFIQLIKSGKLIPVMIGSKIVLNKSYSLLEYVSAVLIGFGLSFLVLEKMNSEADTHAVAMDPSGVSHVYGFLLLMIALGMNELGLPIHALVADAFVGNFQEKVMKEYSATQEDTIYYCYLFGSACLFLVSVGTGEFVPAVVFCLESVYSVFWIVSFSVTGYLGLIFIMAMIQTFGTFVAVTITSTRKVVSISLSFLLFPKLLSVYFVYSFFLVFCGIFIHIYAKNKVYLYELLHPNSKGIV